MLQISIGRPLFGAAFFIPMTFNHRPHALHPYGGFHYVMQVGRLKVSKNSQESKITYNSADESAEFVIMFEEDAELTGYLNLKLWVSSGEATDMDLFITVRKLDRNGNQVLFDNCHVPGKWPMALGWLRLSHRELDHDRSTPWEPYLKSVVGPGEKVSPGDIVPCEIPILPTSTLFRNLGAHEKLPFCARIK